MIDRIRNSSVVDTRLLAENHNVTTREIRRIISDLTSNKIAIFLPVREKYRPGVYKRVELFELEEIRAFYKEQVAHARSVYFDKILPLAEYLNEKDKQNLYAHIDLFRDMEDIKNDENV